MNTIHDFLAGRHPWYSRWHQQRESDTFHWMIFLMFTLAATASMSVQVSNTTRVMAEAPQVASVVITRQAPPPPAPLTESLPLVVDGVVVDSSGVTITGEEMTATDEEIMAIDAAGEAALPLDVSEVEFETN